MRWTTRNLMCLKNSAVVIGSAVILLYLVMSLIESTSKLVSFTILLPVLIWPYVAYKQEKNASIMAFIIGAIVVIWFIIDFAFLRIERLYWHIPLFILIAPLPAFVMSYMLGHYHNIRKPHDRIGPVITYKQIKKSFIKKLKI
ncbi:hypothetical protein GOV06_00980 [Candidatus Woesearchaeota archaeon]|nr:hypothetical protein [Candidatus Woesearchaeota archaeon]